MIGVAVGAPLSLFAVSHGIDIAAVVALRTETATIRCASRSQYGVLSVFSGAASSVCWPAPAPAPAARTECLSSSAEEFNHC